MIMINGLVRWTAVSTTNDTESPVSNMISSFCATFPSKIDVFKLRGAIYRM